MNYEAKTYLGNYEAETQRYLASFTNAETLLVNPEAETHRPLLSLASAAGGTPSEAPCRRPPVGGTL